jgi:hypothetical protein
MIIAYTIYYIPAIDIYILLLLLLYIYIIKGAIQQRERERFLRLAIDLGEKKSPCA